MLPLAVERSLLDFYKLEDAGTNVTVRGLLIAAPKEAVLTAVNAVERAGLHVARVDLASFALLRAASRLDEEVEAIVDIGAQATTVVVHADGEPLIVRTVPRGGVEVTALVASRLGLGVPEAEELKCTVGLNGDPQAEATAVLREAVRPLISEIRSSFAYLTAAGKQTLVTRLALSGGGALLPGLVEFLNSQLNIDVVLADPTARLRESRRGKRADLGSSAAVSIGLTLGAAA
jgi:type IV pilus assembly protein PilM